MEVALGEVGAGDGGTHIRADLAYKQLGRQKQNNVCSGHMLLLHSADRSVPHCAVLHCAVLCAVQQITRHYAQQTASLEALAHPALDALMRNCNSTNLERVRKIKTQHQRLQGRLQGLREVMERYMGEGAYMNLMISLSGNMIEGYSAVLEALSTEGDQDTYRMCFSGL
jgi:hypothetical protein